MHAIVAVPAAGFAIALWRGLRMTTQPGLVAKPVSPWFLRIVVARSICFTAAAIVLATGQPHRRRRIAGAILGALFAVLFVIEHGYQIFR